MNSKYFGFKDEDYEKLMEGVYNTTIRLNKLFREGANSTGSHRTYKEYVQDIIVTEDGTRYVKVECAYAEVYNKIS